MTTQTANDKKPTTQNNQSQAIVSKVWNFCHMLRDDGVSYGDYLEQITYLIFLKMAFEQQPSIEKAGLELLGFDGRNGASYGVVSRNTCFEHAEFKEPFVMPK